MKVEYGSIVEEKVPFIEYIKKPSYSDGMIFFRRYINYLYSLSLLFMVLELFVRDGSYLNWVFTLLAMVLGMNLVNIIYYSLKYVVSKPKYIIGQCPYCGEEVKLINKEERYTGHVVDKVEVYRDMCSRCNEVIDIELEY